MRQISFFLISLVILFASCTKKQQQQAEAERIVKEWVGKSILFPAQLTPGIYGKDSTVPDLGTANYRILLYVDSSGCTSCRLKLYEWQKLMAEADSTLNGQLSFVFCFQPKNRDELVYILRRDHFDYPVYIDDNNLLHKANHFPSNTAYQCFLLDHENKVLSVGNPAINPGIWKLYKQIISGEISNAGPTTSVKIENPEVVLKDIPKNTKHKVVFRLKNTGDQALVISDIKTSCGCTTAQWDKEPLDKDETMAITAEIDIKEEGYFNKTVSVFANVVNAPLTLTIKGSTK